MTNEVLPWRHSLLRTCVLILNHILGTASPSQTQQIHDKDKNNETETGEVRSRKKEVPES